MEGGGGVFGDEVGDEDLEAAAASSSNAMRFSLRFSIMVRCLSAALCCAGDLFRAAMLLVRWLLLSIPRGYGEGLYMC